MWKRSWIERGIKRGNGQTEWLSGREEGKLERISRREKGTVLQKEKLNGRVEEKTEIAKTLLAKGFEKNEIAEITKLSIEEIENLIKENKKLD